ncbi:MAG: hypothetical protein WD049_08140 [Candidatus Paceibacterota bacterium]
MRTLATDATADQLLDYLASSDGAAASEPTTPTWATVNRSTTCWASGI